MLRKIWNGPERRRHRRIETSLPLAVEVEMFGFEGDSRPFYATGRTLNVSRGGVYAAMDVPVRIGSVCNVFFRDCEARIEPARVQGKVLRCKETDDGFRIAIAFDETLRRLEVREPATVREPAAVSEGGGS